MNSKTEEIASYQDSSLNDQESTTLLSPVVNQFVLEACNIPKRLYCSFCLFDFGFEFLLKSHIQNTHSQEIKSFSNSNLDSLRTDTCSYCHAKFHVDGLLPKHIIRKHQECILGIVSSFDADNNICCNFCTYRVAVKQMKLLFIHLENKHLDNFSELLTIYNQTINGVLHPLDTKQNCPQNKLIDEKIEQFKNLENASNPSENSHKNETLKPILKKGSLYSEMSEINRFSEQNRQTRRLRFDLPDTSFSSIGSDKENLPLKNITRRALSLRIKKYKKKPEKVSPIIAPPETRNVLGDITGMLYESHSNTTDGSFENGEKNFPFKCGACSEKFSNNSVLVHHIKKKHGKINFQPRYKCGLCKAKFFRNSYLIRHNKLHDKSKCFSGFEYKPLK